MTEELLVETRLPEETPLSTAIFFLGFLAVFMFVAFAPGWGATANSVPTFPQAFASSRPQ